MALLQSLLLGLLVGPGVVLASPVQQSPGKALSGEDKEYEDVVQKVYVDGRLVLGTEPWGDAPTKEDQTAVGQCNNFTIAAVRSANKPVVKVCANRLRVVAFKMPRCQRIEDPPGSDE